MNEFIKRIDAAMCREDVTFRDVFSADERHDLIKAALKAMREPTEAMLDDGDKHADDGWGGADTWRAMIDCALNDPTP